MQNLLDKALSGIAKCRKGMALFIVMILVSASFAATDFSALTAGVEGDITSVGATLMGIGAALIGLALIICVYRYIKGAVRGG